ncbi:DUF221-domain-containing protein [Tricholoma matsutake]|nr:DUF221-domain-containing protein [Tricholoma matsutake 945]
MSNIDQSKSASTPTFITALVFNAIVFAVEIAAFTIVRPYFKAIYEPRTYLPPPSKRVSPLSHSIFRWPLAVFRADYRDIIRTNGLDAYFFVRYLRMMVKILLPIWLLSWVVLLPVTSVNTQVGQKKGLDRFIFGNVQSDKQARYAAHLIMVYLFTGWILYNIKEEMKHFIITRQQHLINTVHAKSVQANTLLITGIPRKYLSNDALYKLFRDLPGGVKKIWINRNLKELPDIYDRRLAACSQLESAETNLMKAATKIRLAAIKKGGSNAPATGDVEVATPDHIIVPKDQRPTHRLGMIPFFGEKVDTIDWARKEIVVCTRLLEAGRATIENDGKGVTDDSSNDSREDVAEADAAKGESLKSYPPLNSAFVTFNRQIAAHLASQVLAHHEPYRMSGKYVEVSPEDVIWGNLGLNPYERQARLAISYAATAGLIIAWSIPVAFVGVISNVHQLCKTVSWLAWLCTLPSVVVGIISGILPPVLLAVLMMLLPIVLRLLARFEGIPKRSGLELSLMTRFFIFQVVHSFLIVTLSSGIMAALPGLLNNPTSVPTLLAQQLPQSSTFFLTYIILQGLSGTAGGFLQVITLAIYYVKLFILGSTPRSIYGIKYGLQNVAWGTTFPGITLLLVITLGYSIISPIINGLACATFFLFYMLYKYLFLWVYEQPSTSDTGGLFFPKAIQHIFVGMYVQQVCMAALFFLAQNQNKKPGAVPEGALMVVLIVITVFFNIILNHSYGPLLHALPLSLADKTYTSTSITYKQVGEEAAPLTGKSSASIEESEREPKAKDKSPASRDALAKAKTEDDYGFAHPAVSRPQRTVWLPKDTLGLGEEEVVACMDAGVDASVKDAVMNEKGKVDIIGVPPDLIRED